MSKPAESDLSLVSVYKLIMQNWKLIAIVCFISVVLTSVILLLTPNSFKNTSVFFPVSEQIVDKSSLLNEITYNEATIFAPENVVDRVYNIATSSTVQDYVILKNDLISHYGYDKDKKSSSKKAAKKYAKKIKLRRTPYLSIELTVKDKDYKKAAVIAKDILDKTESIYHGFFIRARQNLINNIDSQIKVKDAQVKIWGDSLADLRDRHRFYGVISPHRSTATIPSTGNINGKAFELIQNLEEMKEKALTDISDMRTIQNQAKLTQAENEYFLNVIQMPTAYMDKAGPMRTLTVLLVLVFTFLAMVVILILDRQYRALKQKANA